MYKNDVSHKFIYFKLMSYFKAHIFVPFHYFVQGFFTNLCSAVSSLALDHITLLYIANELSLCSQCLFVTIIIQNDYEERGWSAYKIWKNHSAKKRTYTSVKRLLKHCKDNGTMNRKEGYDQPRSVTTENTDLIEELICSQEALHTHLAP